MSLPIGQVAAFITAFVQPQARLYTHCPVSSAVIGTHLEGTAHIDRARGALLSQTNHIGPEIPPQQRNPAQRPQTRYVCVCVTI